MRYDYDSGFPHDQTISTTGLNAIVGNNIDIAFKSNSDASQSMNGGAEGNTWDNNFVSNNLGPPYHSGIISVTGLNAYRGAPYGNNIRVDYGTQWPYSGIISQTGLNVIRGNLIDVQFDSTSDAATKMHSSDGAWNNGFSKTRDLGNKYHSGIISVTGLNVENNGNRTDFNIDSNWPYKYTINTTGLNLLAGAGIGYGIESSYPHEYNVFTSDKASYPSTTVTVTNDEAEFVSNTSDFQVVKLLDFSDLYTSRSNATPQFLVEAAFKITSISKGSLPSVGGFGTLNDRKSGELQPAIGQTIDGDVITESDLSSFVPFGGETYVNGSFQLQIGISGGGANSFNNNISTYPITFKHNINDFTSFYEVYRSGNLDYKPPMYNELNYQDPIIIRAGVALNINSASTTVNNTCGLVAKISNLRYIRGYTYDGSNPGSDTFYTTKHI